MPVNGRQLAALRAQLAGEPDEYKRLFAELDWSVDAAGYTALLDAAFSVAVERRFGAQAGAGDSAGDIAAFVADVRARGERAAKSVDQDAAERLIGAVLGGSDVEDVDPRAAITAKQHLLVALTATYDDAALDQFMLEAGKLADQWLA